MSQPGIPDLERELYYLVAKFLENGPCQLAATALQQELNQNKLLVPRKDWKGDDHDRTFEEYNQLNNHIQPRHLLSLADRLSIEVGRSFPAKTSSTTYLLSRSVLKHNGCQEDKIHLTTSKKTACFHSAQLLPSNKLKTTSICSTLSSRTFNGSKSKTYFTTTSNVYAKLCMHRRILGHLASVYCVLFDHTGSIIVTGADDNLLKVWSARDGRLMATFRGHSGQITDIAINKGNQFIASGSLDKTIRVWDLHTTAPVAVLQGHSGMITSLQFCPCADPKVRYLMSTGGDGNVCFWSWYPENGEFSLTPNKFNEKTRAGVQMLCSSFSPGGSFLVTGSTDNYIRVYQLYPNEPEKIAELPNHVDHVDSIIYSNNGTRFLSGSRDGMAMVWSFKSGEWQAKCLDSSMPLVGNNLQSLTIDPKNKLKVTMICWSTNDKYVITAATDFHLRVWDSYTAKLVHPMKGHTDEVYILEPHPFEQNLLLSAGHDGNLILWDVEKCCQVKVFFNMLEGQGHGAIFDCKFSPTGQQFSATDSHGHLLIFGFGNNHRFRKVPTEQFFHSDYRPILRDTNNYVLDDQTQMAPHLMPPPYLVDIDGNPYPSQYQMLIPGRTSSNLPQLRLEEEPEPENLPPLLAEITAAEAAERGLQSPGPSRRQSEADNGLLSPGGVGLRESGNVEGVRQETNQYISGDITDADAEAWRGRTIIPKNYLYNQSENDQNRLQHSIDEVSNYNIEKRKVNRKLSESKSEKNELFSRRRGGGRGRGGRGRQARAQIISVRPSALRNLEYLQPVTVNSSESEPEDWQGESSDSNDDSDWVEETKSQPSASARSQRRKKRSERLKAAVNDNSDSDIDVVGSNDERSSDRRTDQSSDEENESSCKEQQLKSTRSERAKITVVNGDSDDEDDGDDEDGSTSGTKRKQRKTSRRGKTPAPKENPKNGPVIKKQQKKVKTELITKKPLPSVDDVEAYLACFAPPEWLLNVESKKFPYFPQIGDEVYYLRQGHHLYVQEVLKQNEYDIQESRQAYRRYDLSPAELCKMVGITYDVGPPKMCSLKLELIGKRKSTGNRRTITVRFHDMPNVVDFLVLKHIYEDSLKQDWVENDRFRCIIDDTWYFGTIVEVSPFSEEFITSSFLSLVVKWDSGDDERVSPWDLEKIPDDTAEIELPVTEDDKKVYEYISNENDWPHEDLETLRKRAVEGLEAFSALEIASPFAYPVDVHLYPTYWGTIAFPTDLETINKRINNRFYRRIDSLLWEVRQLKTNAEKFNEKGSGIVQDATQIVKMLCRFLKDPACTDILALYNEMIDAAESKGKKYTSVESEEESDDEGDEEGEEDGDGDGEQGGSSSRGHEFSRSGTSSSQDWVDEAKSLIEFVSSKDDAKPFLQPVDLELFPDYADAISEAIDISVIRHRLDSEQYDSAEAYVRDFQLMFRNSKTYNTDRRSLIYKMTLRLSALFDSRCEVVRKAFTSNSSKSVHMTRGRTRNTVRKASENEDFPSTSKRHSTNGPRTNGTASSEEIAGSSRGNRTSRVPSPRKPIINKITLVDYIQKPSTRSRRSSSQEDGASPSKRGRDSIVKTEPQSSDNSEDGSSEGGEEEEEVKEEDIEEEEDESSPETSHRKSPRNSSRRSGRVPVKRVRYGFESEEEVEENNKPAPKKMRRTLNYSMDKQQVNGGKKPLRISSVNNKRASGRSRTAVSYCEDGGYDYDDFAEEVVAKKEDESPGDVSSSTEEEVEETDSSAEEEEVNVPVSGVSSRGRVRKVATRFLDYS